MIPLTIVSAIQAAPEMVGRYGRMIKFSHTVFALPFALSALVLARRSTDVTLGQVCWILLAMVGARSAAMGFNRITDRAFDAQNPRTSARELPAGKLSTLSATVFVILSAALFVFSAAMLGRLTLVLSLPVLAVLLSYSYLKRFTWWSHLYLGFAISLSPLGTWIAITQGIHPPILLLSLALMAYIAGFDILYACQDLAFDRSAGLFSIPAQFGAARALMIAKCVHCAAYGAFLALYFAFDMGPAYLMTVGIIGGLLTVEHWLVKPDDLSRVNIAFFHINSLISIILFLGVLGDEWMKGIA